MSDILLHEVKGKTEIITFNNPDKLNVLSDEMLKAQFMRQQEIVSTLDRINRESVRIGTASNSTATATGDFRKIREVIDAAQLASRQEIGGVRTNLEREITRAQEEEAK